MQSATAPSPRLAAQSLLFLLLAVFQAACAPADPANTFPTSTARTPAASAVAKPIASPIPAEPLGLPATAIAFMATNTASMANATSAPASTATPDSGDTGWQTYQSQLGGYSVEHPTDWLVDEQQAAAGSLVTAFAPAAGGTGISVIVHSGEVAGAGYGDIPNTRCQAVTVGGLPGVRCLDTINQTTTTILVANGKTYQIAALGKHVDESQYNRFLETFRLT